MLYKCLSSPYAIWGSFILITMSLITSFLVTPNKGIEFGGGYAITLNSKVSFEPSVISQKSLASIEVQESVTTIKFKADIPQSEITLIKQKYGADLLSVESISSSYGAELIEGILMATGIAFLVVSAYTALRHNSIMAVAVLLALFHDIIISIGAALLFGVEINSLLIAGLVMIIGYSINDSIVTITQISDNIRESIDNPIERAITAVLPRSITTSISTLIVIVVLMVFLGLSSGTGGFIVVLATGVVTGTFSSLIVVPFIIGLTDKATEIAPKKSLEGNV